MEILPYSGPSDPGEYDRIDCDEIATLRICLNGERNTVSQMGTKGAGNLGDQARIEYFMTLLQEGDTVYFPQGVYDTKALTFDGLYPQGDGANSVFVCNSADGLIFNCNARTENSLSARALPYEIGEVRDFSVICMQDAQANDIVERYNMQYTGLYIRKCAFTSFSNISVVGFRDGVDFGGQAWSCKWRSCLFRENFYGLHFQSRDDAEQIVSVSGQIGNQFKGASGTSVSGCEIQANVVGVKIEDYGSVDIPNVWLHHGLSIYDNQIEGNMGAGIIFGSRCAGLNITDNYFEKNCQQFVVLPDGIDLRTDDITLATGIFDPIKVNAHIVQALEPSPANPTVALKISGTATTNISENIISSLGKNNEVGIYIDHALGWTTIEKNTSAGGDMLVYRSRVQHTFPGPLYYGINSANTIIDAGYSAANFSVID